MKSFHAALGVMVALGLSFGSGAGEQDPAGGPEQFKMFKEMLSGVKLVGHFTVIGKQQENLPEEEYTIHSVEKLAEEDFWKFEARIKYGNKDYTVPLPLRVKWAGDTPMITLTDFSILGQGPFSARVLFYNGKYAGTWSHGKVGGHLFGKIVKLEENEKEEEDQKTRQD